MKKILMIMPLLVFILCSQQKSALQDEEVQWIFIFSGKNYPGVAAVRSNLASLIILSSSKIDTSEHQKTLQTCIGFPINLREL